MARTLVFTATFNERENVEAWIEGVSQSCPDADLLVIDDSSPDGTGDLLDDLSRKYQALTVVHRPEKSGLASAHLAAMRYAQEDGYEYLVTMDADGSHQPWQIPHLLEVSDSFDFIIGSRYHGGSHRASMLRRVLSWGANSAARTMLPTGLTEYTTSFRVLNENARQVVLSASLRDDGYAFFLEVVEAIHQSGLLMAEIPIIFIDRVHGSSKIPRTQILTSMRVLIELWRQRIRSRNVAEA